jgi:hypothetical protein
MDSGSPNLSLSYRWMSRGLTTSLAPARRAGAVGHRPPSGAVIDLGYPTGSCGGGWLGLPASVDGPVVSAWSTTTAGIGCSFTDSLNTSGLA